MGEGSERGDRVMIPRKRRSYIDVMALGDRIPEGTSGEWCVERKTVESSPVTTFAALRDGRRAVPPGTYTGLLRNGEVVMSDTPAERHDHISPYLEAERRGGRVLVHGLGLGMLLGAILQFDQVKHVDVVEVSEDVLTLVAPSYQGYVDQGRLTIHHANCFEMRWPTGSHWTVVWHDIWNTICADNLPEMATLHRKFGRRCDWQGSWCKEEIVANRRRGGYW